MTSSRGQNGVKSTKELETVDNYKNAQREVMINLAQDEITPRIRIIV